MLAIHLCAVLIAASEPPQEAPARLTKEQFAAILKDDPYPELAEEIETVWIEDLIDKNLYLDNLAHLPELKQIWFDKLPFDSADLKRVRVSRATELKFSGYKKLDIALLRGMDRIESLDFYRCGGIDWSELKGLRGLKRLDLNSVALSARDVQQICELEQVETIVFAGLRATDKHLQQLKNLPKLRSLAVYNCYNVKGSFLAQLPANRLQEFRFTGPKLEDAVAKSLSTQQGLRVLTLNCRSQLADGSWELIATSCPNLQSLELHYQRLGRDDVDAISQLPELTELSIYSDGIFPKDTKSVVPAGVFLSLGNSPKLRTLSLSHGYTLNQEEADAIFSSKSLEEVSLEQLTFEDVASLGRSDKLAAVSLSNITVSGKFPDLQGQVGLRTLEVSETKRFINKNVASLAWLPALEELTLNKNGDTDVGMQSLAKAPKLRKLSVTNGNYLGFGFVTWPKDHPLESLNCEGPILLPGIRAIAELGNIKDVVLDFPGLFPRTIDIRPFADSDSIEKLSLIGGCLAAKDAVKLVQEKKPDLELSARWLKDE